VSRGGFPFLGIAISLDKPLKPFKTHAQQIDVLLAREMAISDRVAALRALQHYGYYRLVGYSFPLRAPPDPQRPGDYFAQGVSLDLVCQIAEFDKRLRLLILNAIESVEIATRVAIAYRLGRKDPLAHFNVALLDRVFTSGSPSKHEKWVADFREKMNSSKEDFVDHHLKVYGGQMPIWVGIELWSFGMLSRFFEGMSRGDRDAVARSFGDIDGRVFSTWLRNLSFARNVVAHHGRLWNRVNPNPPSWPEGSNASLFDHIRGKPNVINKVYATSCILRTLLKSCESDREWHGKLKNLIQSFPVSPIISLRAGGFPTDWDSLALWS
jgi:abortive infection bacteriophage resistance protein